MTVGERIRLRRVELGWTQLELALRLQTDSLCISRWERGATPRAETLKRVADVLGVTVDWLISGNAETAA